MYRKCLLTLIIIGSAFGDSGDIFLQFEKLFPDSLYNRAHRVCSSIWTDIELAHGKEVDWKKFNNVLFDHLVSFYHCTQDMLSKKCESLPDNLEYLMTVMQILHGKYAHLSQTRKNDPYSDFIHELFSYIQERFETYLEQIPGNIESAGKPTCGCVKDTSARNGDI